jgi:TolB-like protein/tetratricopeptide (TPR) repeat protein
MSNAHVERRLTAILAADVAGYSRLMGLDEEGTLAQFRAHRRALIDPKITENRGRIVKTTGDGLLVEFASVVDAVRCAVEVQRGMIERNADVPQGKRVEFRIGINVGDIIIEDGDIFGDGVNVAARLEGLAEPGGICVSGRVEEDVQGKLDSAFEDIGEQQLKNIARPVRVYRVRPRGTANTSVRAVLSLPDKPSIAVLPFQNMSGDPEQGYFADGVVEEITTALSRFKTVFVIARNSSFTYKDKAAGVKQIGRELGVRYVLEGSVRKAANQVRITAQLIDATTGVHLWADRFDGAIEDIFHLQDQVTTSVVGAITPAVERTEIERALLKPTASLAAYDHYMRGLGSQYQWTSEATSEALGHYYKAIELDPKFASAHALATCCFIWRKMNGWLTDPAREVAETKRLAERATELDQDDAQVLCWSGAGLAFVVGEIDQGVALVDRALRLNPNLMEAWLSSGLVRLVLGEWEIAIDHFTRAMRLSPFDPMLFAMQGGIASGHFNTDRYYEAAVWSAKSIAENPKNLSAWRIAAASNALSGRLEQAQNAIARLRELDPNLRIATLKSVILSPLPDVLARMEHGLRKAGLPE